MAFRNFEFKARVKDSAVYENRLNKLNPEFRGEDHQKDTYFHCRQGRLKLREGNVENALIFYHRSDDPKARESSVTLQKVPPDSRLREILAASNGVWTVVEKKRRIYFVDNVKFHFDKLEHLGDFVEVEVIDRTGKTPSVELMNQCEYYRKILGIEKDQIAAESYSDMMRVLNEQK